MKSLIAALFACCIAGLAHAGELSSVATCPELIISDHFWPPAVDQISVGKIDDAIMISSVWASHTFDPPPGQSSTGINKLGNNADPVMPYGEEGRFAWRPKITAKLSDRVFEKQP